MSAQEVAELATEAIRTYGAVDDRWKTIGGPVDVLLVDGSGCRWLEKNSPDKDWTYIQDLVLAYRAGELKILPIPPSTKRDLEDLLATIKL